MARVTYWVAVVCALLLMLIVFYFSQKQEISWSNVADRFPETVTSHITLTKWWQASALFRWEWQKPMEYDCKKKVAMGNWHVCMDKPYEIKPPCLVYSFGISNDWTFDDAMGNLGCEVHSFDPSIGKPDFNRSKNVHFHNLGIASFDSDSFVARKDVYVHNRQIWKMRRVQSVKKMLGHADKTIDVLKIDVETSEWPSVKDLVESGCSQVSDNC